MIVSPSSLFAQQNGRNFIANHEEIKAFIGVNYLMAINQLSHIIMYWNCDHFTGHVEIQNIFTRTRYQEIS